LAIYLLSPTRDFYWDGVAFAIDIEKAAQFPTPLLHPNHLTYNPLAYGLFELARLLAPSTRALFVLQALDSVLAAASALLVYKIVRRSGATPSMAATWTLLFAFSATWWKFATDADAYIASIFFLLCGYFALTEKQPRPLVIAGLHSVAMLFHELAALFFPAAVFLLYRRQRIRPALRYVVSTLLLTIGAYWIAYDRGARSGPPVDFFAWITEHSPDSQWTFDIPRSAGLTALGTVRLFLGGKVAAWNFDWVTRAGCVLLVVAALAMVKRVRPKWMQPTIDEAPLWIWIASYSLFLLFFQPQNTFYRLFYFPALIFLLASRLRGSLAMVATAVFLWNFTFFVYPRSRVESNETLAFALRERSQWPGGSGIAYHIFHPDLWTIAYFNWQVSWIDFATPDIPRLESLRSDFESSGRSLWLEQTTVDLLQSREEGKQWLASHVDAAAAIRHQSAKRAFAFYRVK
jgi:hypothetical protein